MRLIQLGKPSSPVPPERGPDAEMLVLSMLSTDAKVKAPPMWESNAPGSSGLQFALEWKCLTSFLHLPSRALLQQLRPSAKAVLDSRWVKAAAQAPIKSSVTQVRLQQVPLGGGEGGGQRRRGASETTQFFRQVREALSHARKPHGRQAT